jgi:DNA-binding NarL/FixJ family response regulator
VDYRLLLVESNEILRKGLSCALAQSRRIRITEVPDSEHAVAAAERERFEVAILGMGLSDEAQHALIASLRQIWEGTRCILIMRGASHRELERALRSTADGILLGDSSAQELWAAIESVRSGRRYWPRTLEQGLVDRLRPGFAAKTGSFGALTNRERTILHLIGEGESNLEIAATLGLSRRTVDTHRTRLMRKLGIHKTAALVRFAVREGLIDA